MLQPTDSVLSSISVFLYQHQRHLVTGGHLDILTTSAWYINGKEEINTYLTVYPFLVIKQSNYGELSDVGAVVAM